MKNKIQLITVPLGFLIFASMIMFSSTPQASINRPFGYWDILTKDQPKEE